MMVRCFFSQDGKLRRVVFADNDASLVHHKAEADEVVRDIPHDIFHGQLITINDAAIEAFHAAQK